MANWWEAAPVVQSPAAPPVDWNQLAPAVEQPAPIGQGESFLRGAEQGLTLGWGDEIRGRSAAAPKKTEGARIYGRGGAVYLNPKNYEEGQKVEDAATAENRAANEAARVANPKTFIGGQIAGGVLPAVVAAPVSGAAQGMSIAPRVLAGVADATLQGAVGGAGTAEEGGRLKGALEGAGWGAALGLGGQALSAGASKGIRTVLNALASRGDESIAGVSKSAAKYATDLFSDPAKNAALRAEINRLGPDATLADVSPEWLMVARGAAARPGSRDAIVNALLERQGGANQRLGYDLDAALGRRVVPSEVEAGLKAQRKGLSPLYEQAFAGSKAVDNGALAQTLDASIVNLRGKARSAAQEVRDMLNLHGTSNLDPNPRTLFETRKAIDGMLKGEADDNVRRVLGDARTAIDTELTAKVPNIKGVDALWSDLKSQSDALVRGQDVLENGKTALRPEELSAELAKFAAGPAGPSIAPQRLAQGARAEIDRVVGTNANDAGALKKLVRGEGDWNRQKLADIFGPENADAALGAIDREVTFGQTANQVAYGSPTAPTASFEGALTKIGKPTEIPANLTWLGLAGAGGKKVFNVLSENAAAKNASRFASDLGQTAVSNSAARDRIIAEFMRRAERRATPLDPKIQLILDALAGTRQGISQELEHRRGK